jgi:circadian clock protein KaiC
MSEPEPVLTKLPTHLGGLDFIFEGGLPEGRTSLVAGTAGSAKTVLSAHFLAAGIREANQSGVFVTFEESPRDITRNMASFGWDIPSWERTGRWRYVDASPSPDQPGVEIAGSFDLGALMARVENAVRQVGATRVALDSVSAVFGHLPDEMTLRHELFRLVQGLRMMGVTAVLTAERPDDHGPITRHALEEFVTDNVILLRNVPEGEKRRRTVEVLKFRGATHRKGEYPFSIIPGVGIVLIPLSASGLLGGPSSAQRITSGNTELDAMCGGGFFRDSIVLVSGATGTGKTLLSTEYVRGGARVGERCLLVAFEEGREQLLRNAGGWGVDFEQLEAQGTLRIVCEHPDASSLEDHLIHIRDLMREYRPHRLAVDGLSALERSSTTRGFREFVFGLTSFVKQQGVNGLFTSTTPTLLGGGLVTEAHISSITDSVILLRYVEVGGEMRRGIMVLKMRGSGHDRRIRDFAIDGQGMHIGAPFRNISGILSGNPRHVTDEEIVRLDELFGDGLG